MVFAVGNEKYLSYTCLFKQHILQENLSECPNLEPTPQ